MLTIILLPALLSPVHAAEPDPALATWSSRTGVTLSSRATDKLSTDEQGMVVSAPGTSLVLQLDLTPRQVLEAQVAPFVAAGIAAPTWKSGPCTVAGQAATCISGVLVVGPGSEMRLMAGSSEADGYTAACLDRSGGEGWPAPCAGVIGG